MDRLKDLIRFYSLLGRLEEAAGGKRVLASCNGRVSWPSRGVYFFFEDGEFRSDSGEGLRVVRVGTHALKENSKTTLWKRLCQHRGTGKSGGGNHRGSIFRLLVGTAIVNKEPAFACATWDQDRPDDERMRVKEQALERSVSAIIGAMPLLWIGIDDAPGPGSRRGTIERNAIALLSNHARPALDSPSASWLGRHCDREKVCSSGLWNSRHVDEPYDPGFLDDLAALIDARSSS